MTADELRAIVGRDAAFDIDPETDRLVYFWRGKPEPQVTDPAAVRDRRALLALLREVAELHRPITERDYVQIPPADVQVCSTCYGGVDDWHYSWPCPTGARLAALDPTGTPTEPRSPSSQTPK